MAAQLKEANRRATSADEASLLSGKTISVDNESILSGKKKPTDKESVLSNTTCVPATEPETIVARPTGFRAGCRRLFGRGPRHHASASPSSPMATNTPAPPVTGTEPRPSRAAGVLRSMGLMAHSF